MCAGGLVTSFGVQVDFSLPIYSTYRHLHVFLENSVCREFTSNSLPLMCLVIHWLPGFGLSG